MPTYRYGFDADDRIADALELPADRVLHNGPFTCAGCGNPVVAKTKGEHGKPLGFAPRIHDLVNTKRLNAEVGRQMREVGRPRNGILNDTIDNPGVADENWRRMVQYYQWTVLRASDHIDVSRLQRVDYNAVNPLSKYEHDSLHLAPATVGRCASGHPHSGIR